MHLNHLDEEVKPLSTGHAWSFWSLTDRAKAIDNAIRARMGPREIGYSYDIERGREFVREFREWLKQYDERRKEASDDASSEAA